MDRRALLALLILVGGCTGASSGSGSTAGGSSGSSTGSSGSTGGPDCDAGVGEGHVQGWPELTDARATQHFTYVFADGGADPGKLTVTLDRYFLPITCPTPTTGGQYARFRIVLDTTTGGGVGPGTYGLDDGGAALRWEFGSDTSGGADSATRGAVTLDALGGTGAHGSFAVQIPDLVASYPDGGKQLDDVSGTFTAPYAGYITEP